jgi:hypothetical protein
VSNILEEHRLKVLRITSEHKKEEEVGGWRRLYNEELHNLYGSPNVIRMNTQRGRRWAWHAVCMEAVRDTKFWSKNQLHGAKSFFRN